MEKKVMEIECPKRYVGKKRMLITGSTGLVGSYFCRLVDLKKKYDIYTAIHSEEQQQSALASSITFGNQIQVDLSNSMDLFRQAINRVQPDIILHLAAMTDVDLCEIQRSIANNINHLSVKELVNYTANANNNKECFILHVSTDYVFDGEKGGYDEADKTNPINWYGMTKLLAEQELLSCSSENWCIARTSTPFGIHPKKLSFPLFVLKNLSQNHEINVMTDQITSPTYAFNLAEMLLEIIDKRIKGIIHLSGSSQVSRFDQATMIASTYDLDKNLIKPTSINEMNWKARRPKNSSLSTAKASNTLSKKPMGFKESLLKFAAELQR
jgi:dTDP-4-dehydrorhamnose reductase